MLSFRAFEKFRPPNNIQDCRCTDRRISVVKVVSRTLKGCTDSPLLSPVGLVEANGNSGGLSCPNDLYIAMTCISILYGRRMSILYGSSSSVMPVL